MTHEAGLRTGSITLEGLLTPLGEVRTINFQDVPVAAVTDDSRQVKQGSLFVAVRGEKLDGHGFIAEAVRWGASAVVCQDLPEPLPGCPVIQVSDSRLALSALASAFYGNPAERLCMVAVTGTDGKTTTTELCRAILCEWGRRAGSLGTVSYNLPTRSLDSSQTTPHPLLLHAMLREMADGGVTDVCMEVSSHALIQRRTAHINFAAAILTNVTEDHLDFHGTIEAYIRAKQILFEQLSDDAFAILNADSQVCERYREATRANVLTYGVRNLADVRAERREATNRGMDIFVRTPLESYTIRTPLVGDYNCENVLAAVTLGFAFGAPKEVIRRALKKCRGVAGRLERIDVPGRPNLPAVFVDYAHTPNALRKVLTNLRAVTSGKLICVFGCGGNRERQKRPVMGAIAASLADLTVITSDNSRDERTEDIIAGIVGGIKQPHAAYVTHPDRRLAIAEAIAAATSPEDVVAICGKGCEQFLILGDQHIPFDDRLVAREILKGKKMSTKKIA